MLNQIDFERWIKAVHDIFEIFEGRFDAYPISRRWIEEWYTYGFFNVSGDDIQRLDKLKENFEYSAFGVNNIELRGRIDNQFKNLVEELSNNSNCENIGFGVALYLFTWNFQRFKIYFQRNTNFNLIRYFQNLEDFFADIKDMLGNFSKKKIYSNEIEYEDIKEIFNRINDKLKEVGINQNEPIGVVKLLHIFAPYYFPLIDNPIAKTTGLKHQRESLKVGEYVKWMRSLRKWIESYDEKKIREIEKQCGESILKLIDEGFYVMSSVNLSLRIKLMGLEIGDHNK